jgi:DNA uptake protein ComE-like DNA-binding protein
MKSLVWFLAGIGSAAALAQFASWRRKSPRQSVAGLDLNHCSREELLRLPGLSEDSADRILENRPYRSKFDLLNRLIIPDSVYIRLRSQVYVEPAAASQAVQIA